MEYQGQRKLALKLFKGKKYKELRDAIRDGKCFDEILPIAEKAGAVEFWDDFIDEWIYWAGCNWSIPEETLIKAFLKLKNDEWIYRAGCNWSIPEKILIKGYLNLEDREWRRLARRHWPTPEEILKTIHMLQLKEKSHEPICKNNQQKRKRASKD